MHNSHSVFLHAASPSVYWTVCHLNRPRTGGWGSYVFTPARCYMRLRVHWADANGRLIRSARGRQASKAAVYAGSGSIFERVYCQCACEGEGELSEGMRGIGSATT